MENNLSEVIASNLVYITEQTNNIQPQLINHLIANKVINMEEGYKVKLNSTPVDKMTDLCYILTRKPGTIFLPLVKSLCATENSHVAEVLIRSLNPDVRSELLKGNLTDIIKSHLPILMSSLSISEKSVREPATLPTASSSSETPESTNTPNIVAPTTLKELDYMLVATTLQQQKQVTISISGFHINFDKLLSALASAIHLQNISITNCTFTIPTERRIYLPNLKTLKLELYEQTLTNIYLQSSYANLNWKSFIFFYNQFVNRDWAPEKMWELNSNISLMVNDVNIVDLSHNPCHFSASYITSFSDIIQEAKIKATTLALNRISNADLLTRNSEWQNSITNLVLVAIDFVDFPNFISNFKNVTFLSLCHSKRAKYDLYSDLKDLHSLKVLLISSAEIIVKNLEGNEVASLEELQFHECAFATAFELILKLYPNISKLTIGEYTLGNIPPVDQISSVFALKNLKELRFWWFKWDANSNPMTDELLVKHIELESLLASKGANNLDHRHQYFLLEKEIDKDSNQWESKTSDKFDLLSQTQEKFMWTMFWKNYQASWKYWG